MNKIVATLAAFAAFASVPAAAVTAFASFNGVNGNAGFTYGYTDGVTLTAFDTTATGAGCALSGATCLIASSLGVLPFASIGGSFPSVDVPANAIVVHPGNSDSQSNYVSFTTPTAGSYTYSIDIQSRGIDTTNGIGYRTFTSVGGIVTLGARSVIPNYLGSVNIAGTTVFGLGDQFGFIIDRNGVFFGDSTGVNFSIASAVPEPATWGLMLVGFGLVGVAARRRSGALAA